MCAVLPADIGRVLWCLRCWLCAAVPEGVGCVLWPQDVHCALCCVRMLVVRCGVTVRRTCAMVPQTACCVLCLGRPAWFLHAPYPEDSYSTMGAWVKEQEEKVNKAKTKLQKVQKRQWDKKNKKGLPARGRLGVGAPESSTCLATFYKR